MWNLLIQELKKPYGPLIPWVVLAAGLFGALMLVRTAGTEPARLAVVALEAEWRQAREDIQLHRNAVRAKKDLAQVRAALPDEHDFAPLALGITEESKRNHVTLPSLSYKTEATAVPNTSKGVLEGTLTGKYEDLRRFLYDIETAEELVYIEDLVLLHPPAQHGNMTFNIKIATYLKGSPSEPS